MECTSMIYSWRPGISCVACTSTSTITESGSLACNRGRKLGKLARKIPYSNSVNWSHSFQKTRCSTYERRRARHHEINPYQIVQWRIYFSRDDPAVRLCVQSTQPRGAFQSIAPCRSSILKARGTFVPDIHPRQQRQIWPVGVMMASVASSSPLSTR